jgi:hypothetical protein
VNGRRKEIEQAEHQASLALQAAERLLVMSRSEMLRTRSDALEAAVEARRLRAIDPKRLLAEKPRFAAIQSAAAAAMAEYEEAQIKVNDCTDLLQALKARRQQEESSQ